MYTTQSVSTSLLFISVKYTYEISTLLLIILLLLFWRSLFAFTFFNCIYTIIGLREQGFLINNLQFSFNQIFSYKLIVIRKLATYFVDHYACLNWKKNILYVGDDSIKKGPLKRVICSITKYSWVKIVVLK